MKFSINNLFLLSTFYLLLNFTNLSAQIDSNRSKWITELGEAYSHPLRVYHLDLSKQSLDSIPNNFSQFQNLRSLRLSDNQLVSIGDVLSNLNSLDYLDLSENQLDDRALKELASISPMIKELVLDNNLFTSIDQSLSKLKYLEVLSLRGNKITSISEKLFLGNLKTLNLDENLITESKVDFAKSFPKIEFLSLNANEFTQFTLDAKNNKLRKLNIGDNPLETLTIQPGKYKLKSLILDWVNFKNEWFSILPNSIKILSLEHCSLNTIEGIESLNRLNELSLISNELQTIEENMANLKKMKKIWLTDNPINNDEINRLKRLTEVVY